MRALSLQTGRHSVSTGIRFAPTAAEALRHLRSGRDTKRVDSSGAHVAEEPSVARRRENVLQAAGEDVVANSTPAILKLGDSIPDDEETIRAIERYRIRSEAERIEIAKTAAAQDGYEVSRYIQHYGIQSQTALVEIAKIAAAQSGIGTSAYIKNYGIKSEVARIEIAKIAVAERR